MECVTAVFRVVEMLSVLRGLSVKDRAGHQLGGRCSARAEELWAVGQVSCKAIPKMDARKC